MTDQLALPMTAGVSLREAAATFRARVTAKPYAPVICACCGRTSQTYKRKIHAQMARWMISLWRATGGQAGVYRSIHDVPARGGDYAKLLWWGLVEHRPGPSERGGRESGEWALTWRGVAFVEGRDVVRKHRLVLNGRVAGEGGPNVTIRDCLGKRFDYEELMHGVE